MDVDFSTINHMYLSKARQISVEDPVAASAILGLPVELTRILADIPLEEMSKLISLKPALVTLRMRTDWWENLLASALHGDKDVLDTTLRQGLMHIFA